MLTAPLYALLALPYLAFFSRPGAIVATVLVAVASIGYAGTLTLQERFVTSLPEGLLGQGMGLVGNGMMTTQAVSAAAVGGVAELTGPGLAMTITAAASLMATAALCPRLSPAVARTEPVPVTSP